MFTQEILSQFWLFLRGHDFEKNQAGNPYLTLVKLSVINTLIAITVVMAMFMIFSLIDFVTGLDLKESTKNSVLNSYSQIDFFLIGVLLAPTLEELCFRFSLKPSQISISISIGLFLGAYLSKWIFFGWSIPTHLMLSIGIASLVYFFLRVRNFEPSLSPKKLIFFCYFSSLVFGLIHLRNQKDIEWYEIVFSPIITMPQIALGLFLSYARLRFGLQYSIAVHILNNFLVFCIKY